ncbi:MAG: hypothetical protein ABFS21_10725 [Actinomycetota bacterium]
MDRRSTLTLFAIAAIVIVAATAIAVLDDDGPPLSAPPATTATTTSGVGDTTTTTAPSTTEPPPATLPPGTTVCDRYSAITVAGSVAAPGLVEASGMAASRIRPGMLWSHNDSRDGARVYAIGPDGADLGAFDVAGAHAFDWEDMAIASGPDSEIPYLYLGDIGDNFSIRSGRITVYRVPEPDTEARPGSIEGAVPLEFAYPDGVFNAEALFVADDSLYIVTKDRQEARVYRGNAGGDGSSVETLQLVATLQLNAEVSGATVSWDGATIAFRGYRTVWLWHRSPDESIADTLAKPPCTAPSPDEIQGEAIAFLSDGGYATISEGANPLLNVVPITP